MFFLLWLLCGWIGCASLYAECSEAWVKRDVLPLLPGYPQKTFHVSPVKGGATNDNYCAASTQGSYFVRIGNEATKILGANIENEAACTSVAMQAGLAPPIILFSPEKKVLVTTFIPSQKSVDLRDPHTLSQVVGQIKKLHALKEEFPQKFSPFQALRGYYMQLQRQSVSLDFDCLALLEKLEKLIPSPHRLAPCHLDLHHANLIDDGQKVWLIDWEYAAMADPLLDLAVLAATEHFSDEEMAHLLALYDPTQDFTSLYLYRILADLRWGLWCLIQERQIYEKQIYEKQSYERQSSCDYPYAEEGRKFLKEVQRREDVRKREEGRRRGHSGLLF